MGDVDAKIEPPPPRVSVILPVFNGEKTIRAAVNSILAQTMPDFELIVLDDGSNDRTADLIRMLNDPRLRFVCDGVNKGLATRLNEAVAMARGTYIARMDSDDVSFPDRLRIQADFLDRNRDVDLVAGRTIVFGEDGRIIGQLPFRATHAALTSRVWSNIPLPHPTWMGRAPWFKANPYRMPEVKRAEDQELLLRCLPFSTYATVSDVVLGYRQGKFDLSKTLRARHHLLTAQVGLFRARGQYLYLVLAIFVTSVKVMIDVISAVPGLSSLYFWRMRATNIRQDDIRQLYKLLDMTI